MKIWSDENEKLVEKFFARKKRGSQVFRLRRPIFVMEALKTAKKPLNFPKNVNFLKKGTSKFFACAGLFFETLVGQKRGYKSYFTLPSKTYAWIWLDLILNFDHDHANIYNLLKSLVRSRWNSDVLKKSWYTTILVSVHRVTGIFLFCSMKSNSNWEIISSVSK